MKDHFLMPVINGQENSRREFIATTLKVACATALVGLPALSMATGVSSADITVQGVIDIILKDIPGAPFKDTVDTIKSGSAGNKVNGIVSTMFATVEVIKKAIELKADFIIAHEPTFYNHRDDKKWVTNNHVVAQKEELLAKNNITVWRFHDGIHAHRPDGVFYGVGKKMSWETYFKAEEPTFEIPADSLKNIALRLKDKLGIDHLRVIGDLTKTCKKISMLPGASGGQAQVGLAQKDRPDILIIGELSEWETAEYIRDARLLGNDISLIVLGHSVSEEPGMEWLVEWLQPKIPAIRITHVASNSPFTWL